mmetsp:Transcript_28334/g.32592  ORF Transcript_28334/g.32592 Transcript_28334/m.32592 type:complete len:185 (+) Transcript_28334:54-608(+)
MEESLQFNREKFNRRKLSNGMSIGLNKALQRLKIFSTLALIISLFFFGWSILSFYMTDPLMALFGAASFFASSITSCFLLTDRATKSGYLSLLNVLCSFTLNLGYFGVYALYGKDHVSERAVATSALFFFILWIFLAPSILYLLWKAQSLTRNEFGSYYDDGSHHSSSDASPVEDIEENNRSEK